MRKMFHYIQKNWRCGYDPLYRGPCQCVELAHKHDLDPSARGKLLEWCCHINHRCAVTAGRTVCENQDHSSIPGLTRKRGDNVSHSTCQRVPSQPDANKRRLDRLILIGTSESHQSPCQSPVFLLRGTLLLGNLFLRTPCDQIISLSKNAHGS